MAAKDVRLAAGRRRQSRDVARRLATLGVRRTGPPVSAVVLSGAKDPCPPHRAKGQVCRSEEAEPTRNPDRGGLARRWWFSPRPRFLAEPALEQSEGLGLTPG